MYTHGIGNRDLGLTRMILITLSLPPLPEQRRIVTKINHVMGVCDDLESKLHQSRTDGERLMEAVVHHLATA